MKVKERKKLNKRATAFEQKKSATIFIIKKKKKTENVVNEHKKSYRAKC